MHTEITDWLNTKGWVALKNPSGGVDIYKGASKIMSLSTNECVKNNAKEILELLKKKAEKIKVKKIKK